MSREMKDSGIPWIGEIPKGWNNAKYRYSGIFVKGKLPNEQNVEQLGKPIIGASEMLGKGLRNFSTDENVPTCLKEDVLILWDGANAGIVANNCEGIISSTVVKYMCTDKNFDTKYLFYLLKNGEPFFKSKVNGTTIPHMNQKYINEYLCIQPPFFEQQKIADFLDRKCGEIDEMIALQEKIIEELKAYKQSVITETVTKGLNPDALMRDSGIEWIGKIPEHWEVCRMKNVCCQNSESLSEKEDSKLEFDYVDIGSVSFEKGIFNTEHYKLGDAPSRARRKAKYGDLVMSTVRTYLRAIDVIDTEEKADYIYSTGFAVLTPMPHIAYKFLSYISKSQSFLEQVTTLSRGINYPSINSTDLMTIAISHPPITEQQAIADYLDEICADIDSLIQTKQSKIDSLKEYKKSIIYEYVTGKKEVE